MKLRNFVKKHQQSSGTGVHVSKEGKFVPRFKQKAKFKKEMRNYDLF